MTIPDPCPLCAPKPRPRGWIPKAADLCRDHRWKAQQALAARDWNAVIHRPRSDRTVLEQALREKSKAKRRKALDKIAEESQHESPA